MDILSSNFLPTLLSMFLYILFVLVPLIPACIIYRMFPDTKVSISGPFQNLTLNASGAFAAYIGSIMYFGISIAAHIILILMFFFTVAIFYDAEKNQSSWLLKLRRDQR